MSTTTSNLGLFKYDVNTDTNVPFSITEALNNNWDIIDEKCNGGGLEICDIGMALYVDETKGLRRYLNGQIVDINPNTQAFLNRLKEITTLHPSLLDTEENWQAAKALSLFGQVGKFVFNYSGDEIVSVRLPRVVNVQGLFDLQNLGMTVDESLPNITGTYNVSGGVSSSGAFYGSNSGKGYPLSGTLQSTELAFSAYRSSSTYQDNAPVQQEAIQYPYFIQIATGSETEANIVNTLENVNGFTLLESKYSDKPLYNESWLLSNGQYNAKAVYPTVYESLQVEYNSEIEAGTTVTLPSGVSYTKRGLSVKLSTETYTDYDFVLNTSDETFRLPLKTKLASGKAVVGNGMTLGLANGTYLNGLTTLNTNGMTRLSATDDAYGSQIGSSAVGNAQFANNVSIGVTTDPTKSGIELSDSGLYLYFYVGDIDQNHGIVNMGRIGEQLASLTTVVETYKNGTSGYRIWSDGYCEQWGEYGTKINGSSNVDITLMKAYNSINFNVQITGKMNRTSSVTGYYVITGSVLSINSIRIYNDADSSAGLGAYWRTSGYLAVGQY